MTSPKTVSNSDLRFAFEDDERERRLQPNLAKKKAFSTLDVRAGQQQHQQAIGGSRGTPAAGQAAGRRRAGAAEEGPSLDARVVRQYWLHFQEMERLREEQSTC